MDLQIALLVIIGLLGRFGFWNEKRNRMILFRIFTCFAGLLYCFVLEIMYLFAFNKMEALILSSYEWYLGSWIGEIIISLLYLILLRVSERNEEEKRGNGTLTLLLTAGIVICFPMNNMLVKNMDVEITENMVYGCDEVAEVFRSFSRRGRKRIFCVQ